MASVPFGGTPPGESSSSFSHLFPIFLKSVVPRIIKHAAATSNAIVNYTGRTKISAATITANATFRIWPSSSRSLSVACSVLTILIFGDLRPPVCRMSQRPLLEGLSSSHPQGAQFPSHDALSSHLPDMPPQILGQQCEGVNDAFSKHQHRPCTDSRHCDYRHRCAVALQTWSRSQHNSHTFCLLMAFHVAHELCFCC